eukprot:TRINITY_DN3948_c0_g3_i1.p1 TRINITY_DN3948_c0_g3~~TRINITY_DN3948_c0_g3_i1.p1  ORF type:complete len:324 (+),score=48.28 TRINITY_DN3948_c0_g3_i1:38-1009(+)
MMKRFMSLFQRTDSSPPPSREFVSLEDVDAHQQQHTTRPSHRTNSPTQVRQMSYAPSSENVERSSPAMSTQPQSASGNSGQIESDFELARRLQEEENRIYQRQLRHESRSLSRQSSSSSSSHSHRRSTRGSDSPNRPTRPLFNPISSSADLHAPIQLGLETSQGPNVDVQQSRAFQQQLAQLQSASHIVIRQMPPPGSNEPPRQQLVALPTDPVQRHHMVMSILSQIVRGQQQQAVRGASLQVLRSLPTFQVTEGSMAEGGECIICMEEYARGDTIKILPCAHMFHASCTDAWISRNKTCPVCKHGNNKNSWSSFQKKQICQS